MKKINFKISFEVDEKSNSAKNILQKYIKNENKTNGITDCNDIFTELVTFDKAKAQIKNEHIIAKSLPIANDKTP